MAVSRVIISGNTIVHHSKTLLFLYQEHLFLNAKEGYNGEPWVEVAVQI